MTDFFIRQALQGSIELVVSLQSDSPGSGSNDPCFWSHSIIGDPLIENLSLHSNRQTVFPLLITPQFHHPCAGLAGTGQLRNTKIFKYFVRVCDTRNIWGLQHWGPTLYLYRCWYGQELPADIDFNDLICQKVVSVYLKICSAFEWADLSRSLVLTTLGCIVLPTLPLSLVYCLFQQVRTHIRLTCW